ncbi:hypothetical protein [Psychrobacter jeotgali]|uniref:hypothetical protein n=1 Tax=Psychrobacter jeotgali TaxID=179010 RepID=UPI001919E073|nr:hypothetical protein [Psychrobacter jeotgali]
MRSAFLGIISALTLLVGCESDAGNQASDLALSEEVVESVSFEKETEIVSKIHYDLDGIILCEEDSFGVCIDDVLQDLRAAQLKERHYAANIAAGEASSTIANVSYEEDYYNNGTGANHKQITGPLTPAQAARIDYLVDNDIEVSQEMIDLLNDFTLDGSEEDTLRKFIIERSNYGDGYDASEDCRNPDLTEAEYANACT